MIRTTKALVAVASFAMVTCVQAQSTIGELLDAGAVKLSREQVVAGLSGTKIVGITSTGRAEMNIDLNADGTLSGVVTSLRNASTSGSVGKWTVDENGRTCIDETLTAWSMRHQECFFSYRLGDQSYRTVSDSEERGTVVVKSQTILKKAN